MRTLVLLIRTVLGRMIKLLGLGAVLAAGRGAVVSSMVLGVSPREPLLLIAIVRLIGMIALRDD
jgi:hypothetical protein